MRDDATVEQLLVLANLENLNALFIAQGLAPSDRLTRLNTIARQQMQAMLKNPSVKKLPGKSDGV